MSSKYKTVDERHATVIFGSASRIMGTSQSNDMLVYQGRKEFGIICKDKILADKLGSLMKKQDTFFPRMGPLVKFLEKEGIVYFVDEDPATI